MAKKNKTSEQILKNLENNSMAMPEIKKFKGFYRARDFADVMIKGFNEGKRRGETTHFTSLNNNFTWKRGFLYGFTGYPNSGKTEILRQLALAKSLHSKWNWAIFDPESMSCDDKGNSMPDEIFDSLAHSLVGKSVDPAHKNQMSIDEYNWAIDFIDKHFIIVYPEEHLHTPKTILEYFAEANNYLKIDGYITDPWNKLFHNYSTLLDEYLATQLAEYKKFAIKRNAVNCIVEHPNNTARRADDGSLPVPDGRTLRGGAMWLNALDCLTSTYRPNLHIDPTDTSVDFHIQKMRNQKLNGITGMVSFNFDRFKNRHIQTDGSTPLDVMPAYDNNIFKQNESEEFKLF